MPENVAEMPRVDDVIPTMRPGESPEEYMKRLTAARHSEPVDPNDEMLKQQAMGTFRDPKPVEPEEEEPEEEK